MFKTFKYEDIDKNKIKGSYVLIDVRSPGEYESETIPGAVNIPLFNDEERKLIGTAYVQESVEKAKKLGISFISMRLPDIYEKISKLDKQYDNLIFFCARGGLRSSSIVSLFISLGVNAFKLYGGYKRYRSYINENLPKVFNEIKFAVLYGNTGTGKTDILSDLQRSGMDILDIEGCANHRGSLLGSVGLGRQNTQKMFESLIYESLKNRKTNLVFVEGESKRLGRIILPECLFSAMGNGINLMIEADIETRINNISKDYIKENDDELISSLNLLRKHLSDRNVDRYIDLIKKREYKLVIEELMTKYYDPLYEFKNRSYSVVFSNTDSQKTARDIIDWVNSYIHVHKYKSTASMENIFYKVPKIY